MNLPDKKPVLRYEHLLRSRYGETDQMGYVYYGHYLEYFEVARTEMIRSLGGSYKQLEEDGVMLPVIYSQIEYKNPVFYDEVMRIEVSVYDRPSVRLETYYKIFTERQEAPHLVGQVDLCFVDAGSRRPRKAPGYFLNLINSNHTG